MPREDHPLEAVHATAVAVAGDALLIIGRSGSGKSRLALALMTASTRRCPIRLIGDDRVLLVPTAHGLDVRGHPRIQGFIERRGLGIQSSPFVASAPVRAMVDLGSTTEPSPRLENFPCLGIVLVGEIDAMCAEVLDWWRGTPTTHRAKRSSAA